ncbi:hypothetical protein [Pantoea sp.]|uniref:hypothetical protein n=1 Tax=Pantoea sp. TaxID=69393 RepID=UPI0028A02614|nr:hypothetical protein [Pantoea sp.]
MTDNMTVNAKIAIGESVLQLIDEQHLPDKNALLAHLVWQAEQESDDARLLALWQARRRLHPAAQNRDIQHLYASASLENR